MRADVAVLGAGITGLTTALLLARAGRSVVVCEAGTVGSGVSGHNTGKVTALQGTVYSAIRSRHGAQTAAAYAAGSTAAVERVAELSAEVGGAAERRPAYTYALWADEVPAVRREAAAAAEAGLPVKTTDEADIALPVHAAVRLDDQLMLHPVRYLRGLAEAFAAAGGVLYEGSPVVRVEGREPYRLHTPEGVVTARHVVVATHYPLLDRGLWFARLVPTRSYCIAARLAGDPPLGLAISAGGSRSTRSVASYGDLLILGGESHAPGARSVTQERFLRLEADARRHFGAVEITHRWSAQDPSCFDNLPVIGPYAPFAERMYVASGYMKWGLSTGTLAASIISDGILGRENPWAGAFRPQRFSPRALPELLRGNAKVAADLVGDRLRPGEVRGAAEVPPGEARVLQRGTRRSGVYRDPDGHVHAVSLRCTHLGCLLRFNGAERSWDCPCHGSRFDVDGKVLEGPAVRPLEHHEID